MRPEPFEGVVGQLDLGADLDRGRADDPPRSRAFDVLGAVAERRDGQRALDPAPRNVERAARPTRRRLGPGRRLDRQDDRGLGVAADFLLAQPGVFAVFEERVEDRRAGRGEAVEVVEQDHPLAGRRRPGRGGSSRASVKASRRWPKRVERSSASRSSAFSLHEATTISAPFRRSDAAWKSSASPRPARAALAVEQESIAGASARAGGGALGEPLRGSGPEEAGQVEELRRRVVPGTTRTGRRSPRSARAAANAATDGCAQVPLDPRDDRLPPAPPSARRSNSRASATLRTNRSAGNSSGRGWRRSRAAPRPRGGRGRPRRRAAARPAGRRRRRRNGGRRRRRRRAADSRAAAPGRTARRARGRGGGGRGGDSDGDIRPAASIRIRARRP